MIKIVLKGDKIIMDGAQICLIITLWHSDAYCSRFLSYVDVGLAIGIS